MCEIDTSDWEPCAVWDERQVRARKAHLCDCCGGDISPGEHYLRHFSVADGSANSEKCCASCRQLRDDFGKEHHVTTFPGGLRYLLEECADYGEDDANTARWREALVAMDARRAARREADHGR